MEKLRANPVDKQPEERGREIVLVIAAAAAADFPSFGPHLNVSGRLTPSMTRFVFCCVLQRPFELIKKKIVVRDPAVKVTRWASGEPNNNNNNTLGIYNKIGGRESLFVAHFNGVCVVCVCTLNDTQFKLNYGAPMKSRSVRKHWTLWQHTHSNTQTKQNTLFSKE